MFGFGGGEPTGAPVPDGDAFITRHSIKPKGEDVQAEGYKGISEKGVELAKKRAEAILEYMDGAKDGTVLLMSGVSEEPRTDSTMRVYNEEVKRLVQEQGKDDIVVMDKGDIIEDSSEGYTNRVNKVVEQIQANPDKKFIITFPLRLGGLTMIDRWTTKEGGYTEYADVLLAKNNNNATEAIGDWIGNKGHLQAEDGHMIEGPDPQKVAEEQLESINRLSAFAHKHLGDRPITVGNVGHGYNLDVLAVYLANGGVVDSDGWQKFASASKETEMLRIELDGDKASMKYGDRPEMPIEIDQTAPEETAGSQG